MVLKNILPFASGKIFSCFKYEKFWKQIYLLHGGPYVFTRFKPREAGENIWATLYNVYKKFFFFHILKFQCCKKKAKIFILLNFSHFNFKELPLPNYSGFFHGQNNCPNLFLNSDFITKILLIII